MAAPEVETLLRGLKLPGMADMLSERLSQGNAGRLGHAELLALLCGDEIARRDAAGLARPVAAARFETTCAIEDFDFGYDPDIPAGVIRDLATLRFLAHSESVILHGPVGVGKTVLAQALGSSPAAVATPSRSPRPAGCSPTCPAATPTAPGWPGSAAGGPGPGC